MNEPFDRKDGLFPQRVGERLADARRAQKLELADIATRSRIPLRFLETIEKGGTDALPAAPYSIGFVRTYAQLLGLDGAQAAREFRSELDRSDTGPRRPQPFEPADPARVPPRLLALVALAVALLIAVGYAIWRGGLLSGDSADDRARLAAGTLDDAHSTTPIPGPATAPRPVVVSGPVILTAIEPVWLRVYEADGERLLEKQMDVGERWEVPAGARNPQILTGRPQAIRVTVGSAVIPPLGSAERTIRDVSLRPEALLARLGGPAAPAPPQTNP